jgi:hypothetical protein
MIVAFFLKLSDSSGVSFDIGLSPSVIPQKPKLAKSGKIPYAKYSSMAF